MLFEGMVLDGWHRYRACVALGIKPQQFNFGGDETYFHLAHDERVEPFGEHGFPGIVYDDGHTVRLGPREAFFGSLIGGG